MAMYELRDFSITDGYSIGISLKRVNQQFYQKSNLNIYRSHNEIGAKSL